MFGFPFFTYQQLKNGFPSKPKGRSWKAELKYRNECRDIILACGPPLHITTFTLHKGVVLLHRCLTRLASTEFEKLDKWALATACVFLATKMDSTYHSLMNITHVSYRALREKQARPFDQEYFNQDGSPGNKTFLANLSHKVRDAELAVIFAINFDFNLEVASSIVVYQLRELGLTDALADTKAQVGAVRATAMKLCVNSIVTPNSVLHLMYPARHIALAAISAACKQHGYAVSLESDGSGCVPAMTTQELAVVEDDLMKRIGGGSRAGTPAPSGISGAAAAATTSTDVPGTPAGPTSTATAAPSTNTNSAAAAVGAGDETAAAAGEAGRRSSSNGNGARSAPSVGMSRASADVDTSGAISRLSGQSIPGTVGGHGTSVQTSSVATVAAAAPGAGRQSRISHVGLSVATEAADEGLADEWFQFLGDAIGTTVVQEPTQSDPVGFQRPGFPDVRSKAGAVAAAGVSQVADASALEASTIGPRMNSPSPNSFDSLTGPQAAARGREQQQQQQGMQQQQQQGMMQQQQQQQGRMQHKRLRDDDEEGMLLEPLHKRGSVLAV